MKTSFVVVTVALAVSAIAHPFLMKRQSDEEWTLIESYADWMAKYIPAARKAGPECFDTLNGALHHAPCAPRDDDEQCLCAKDVRDKNLPKDLPGTCSSVLDMVCEFREDNKDTFQEVFGNSTAAHRLLTRRQATNTETDLDIEEMRQVLKEELTEIVGPACASTLDEAIDTCSYGSRKFFPLTPFPLADIARSEQPGLPM
ncbi:hypothetical protein BLS_009448 [Venturia inaequalis]|uniref:Uncharacterized protein n=1 Tax=Venturia inaequalis TaxID=5025 RepID=A0A8H3U556_VENIN|nr:hypothetical protein BLS_009448 [Venturia inaequalis]KAE9985337.1 hypothetical protein EG328_007590 [Venturia inaequalis]RDI86665.1 hypothetical protein Vi05172_g3504 [Venturia inaequalis]